MTDVVETTRLRTDLALAEQRIVALEHERDRLAAALRAAVEAFTRPHCPDGPPHEAAASYHSWLRRHSSTLRDAPDSWT